MVTVRPLEPGGAADARLDAFVRGEPQATIFHTAAWRRVVSRSFPFEPRYLAALDERGGIAGALPLFRVKNPLVAASFVSTPFAVYGGPIGTAEARAALVREASAIADREGVRLIELRNRFDALGGLPVRAGYVTFVRDLPGDPARCLESLPRKARAAARKGIASNLEAIVTREEIKTFHHLFAVNKRHLGSPAFPMCLFRRALEEFGDDCFLLMVRHAKSFVGGVLTFTFRDQVIPYYSGGLNEYEHLQVNNFMYLKLMEWGASRDFRRFDFGRSREGTGPYRFKVHQGFEPTPLPYQVVSRNGAEAPDLSPSNPKFSVPMAVWKRLPLPVTKLLGPFFVRYFA